VGFVPPSTATSRDEHTAPAACDAATPALPRPRFCRSPGTLAAPMRRASPSAVSTVHTPVPPERPRLASSRRRWPNSPQGATRDEALRGTGLARPRARRHPAGVPKRPNSLRWTAHPTKRQLGPNPQIRGEDGCRVYRRPSMARSTSPGWHRRTPRARLVPHHARKGPCQAAGRPAGVTPSSPRLMRLMRRARSDRAPTSGLPEPPSAPGASRAKGPHPVSKPAFGATSVALAGPGGASGRRALRCRRAHRRRSPNYRSTITTPRY
jgi:hypothetical protein